MLSIGDFSKLSRVPIATLRYYDAVGLLSPAKVDAFTSYRYYSVNQLPRLNRILALKDLGFSLEQIGQVLHEQPSIAELNGMLRLKRAEVQQQIADEQARLERIEARLLQIELEGRMPNYEVVVKSVPSQPIASIRDVIATYPDVGRLFEELLSTVSIKNGKITAAIYHDSGPDAVNIDSEATLYLDTPVQAVGRVKVYDLPAATVASVIHHGAYRTLFQAYNAVVQWIDANGYRIAGASREIYLQNENPGATG